MFEEEDRKCIHCKLNFQIIYSVNFGKPDICPFCGSETELLDLDDQEEEVYKEEQEED